VCDGRNSVRGLLRLLHLRMLNCVLALLLQSAFFARWLTDGYTYLVPAFIDLLKKFLITIFVEDQNRMSRGGCMSDCLTRNSADVPPFWLVIVITCRSELPIIRNVYLPGGSVVSPTVKLWGTSVLI
jgi:hypothetical protein